MHDPRTFHGFREHVSEQKFEVFEQPIIHLDTEEISHHEWLVRFQMEGNVEGVIRPAELSGAIKDLDLAMLARAVLRLNDNPDGTGIAINISGASIDEKGFRHALTACLSAFKADPEKLIIELTETWDLHEMERAQETLAELAHRGHPVCLDDVGAGAASIRYLRALPAKWLKIDKDFIYAAFENDRDLAILKALMTLKEPLQTNFIAEGIETQAHYDFVKNLGFDAAQGYFIGKPTKLTGIFA